MDLRRRLTVLHDDGGVFTDYSTEAQDFTRDAMTITLTTDDYLYVGFYKPINALYAEVSTANVNPANLSMEYYNESGVWASTQLSDDSKGLTRSGFLTWARPEDSQATIVNSEELHWVRFAVSADTSATGLQAVNILFSDDRDVYKETPALIDTCFYQSGQTSHVLNHLAAKNYIMGRLRNLGYVQRTTSGEENITEWDILDVYELRQAATYYAISQIYFNLSDDVDDQYWIKYQDYIKRFEESFNLGRLRVDQNDDGKASEAEKRPINTFRWTR